MKEDIVKINKLFNELYETIGIGDINFHRFVDGLLYPVHIMESDLMGIARWKANHKKLKVKIAGDVVLDKIVKGEIVYIYDVPNDPESSPAFSNFGIKSLVVYPLFNDILNKEKVIGLICIPALDKTTEINSEIINQCGKIIEEFNRNYEFISK